MEEDHYMYVKRNKKCFVILLLYYDDIFFVRNNLEMLEETEVDYIHF